MITSLVVNAINFNKNKTLSARRISNGVIDVVFRLSIPGWIDDKEMIKEECHSILYAKSKKTNRYLVNLANVDKGYPHVSNSKYFLINKRYDITSWMKDGIDFRFLLNGDREKIFRETRSNIILQEIGKLTAKWQDVSDGKYHPGNIPGLNYGKRKYSTEVEQEINGEKRDNCPF